MLAGLAACSGETVIGIVHGQLDKQSCPDAPAPVGSVDPANCTRSDAEPCSFRCPDDAGHEYAMHCDEASCACTHNGKLVCLCSVASETAICGGLEPCCPPPWPTPDDL